MAAEPTSLTVVAEDEEACTREVRVELDQDDIGGGVDRLQGRVPAELADLRGRLVRAVPGWQQKVQKKTKKRSSYKQRMASGTNPALITNGTD